MSSETTNIDTSIVLATCSRAKMLRDALESLLVQSWADDHAVEIVVVDDGSTDDTPELLREIQQRSPVPLIVVQGESAVALRRRGTSAGRQARGEWIASFDDDQIAPTATGCAICMRWRRRRTLRVSAGRYGCSCRRTNT